jgi:hypothetical protein
VIMTNTEIKFHISLFTLSSSSVSQSLSFNLLQSLYCPLSSVLALCLQTQVLNIAVKVPLGGGRYAELTEWNGSKRGDLRF